MAEPSEIGPHQRCTLIQINTTSEIGQSLPHRLQSRPNPRAGILTSRLHEMNYRCWIEIQKQLNPIGLLAEDRRHDDQGVALLLEIVRALPGKRRRCRMATLSTQLEMELVLTKTRR